MKLVKFITFSFILFCSSFAYSQTFTESNLPIVIINTSGNAEIPDDPKIPGTMKIISRPNGEINKVSDQNNPAYLNYNGKITIETRGSTSQIPEKKPYGFKTIAANGIDKENVNLLGMPKENDWVLNALNFDPNQMRDYISYKIAKETNVLAPRVRYCEVVVNGNYRGLYLLQESVKVDDDRVNITDLDPDDLSGIELTGGYIVKSDKNTGGDPEAWGMESYNGWTSFIHHEPKPDEINAIQTNYIKRQFTDLGKNVYISSLPSGYPSIIDVPSFLDYVLVNEFSANVDAYQFSTFYHKDRGGKLRAGPVWDFNLSFGNDLTFWGYDRSHTDVWQFDNGDNTGPKYFKDLYTNLKFNCYLAKRWKELSGKDQPMNKDFVYNLIDKTYLEIKPALNRDQERYGSIDNIDLNVSAMKDWIGKRIIWMNGQLKDLGSCINGTLPSLVISAINYNPEGQTTADQEFIEITNIGSNIEDISGYNFRELGLTYIFPNNSKIKAGEKIYIAGNKIKFESLFGKKAFGEFIRDLHNDKYDLVLVNAFGDIIDRVEYKDSSPWPLDADGKGSFLILKDVNLDNNIGSNWIASKVFTSTNEEVDNLSITISPNPTNDNITFKSTSFVNRLMITDIFGKEVFNNVNPSTTINVSSFSPGMYYLNFELENKQKKIINFVKY